jgi:chorismate synthase
MGNFTKARKCKHCNVKNNEEKQTDVNIAKSSDKLKQRINDNFQAFSLNNKEIKEQAEKALKNGDEFIGILENIWDLTAFGYGSIKFQKNKTSIRCLRQ